MSPARTAFFTLALGATALPLAAQDGQQLFTLYCSACHGADGKGATGGTFPPLAASPWVAGDADRSIKIILKGLTGPVDVLGKTYNLEMPPQGAVLPDDQIAAILTYVRSSWGNQSGAVTPDQVKTIRAAISDRPAPWTAEEILKLHPLPLEKTALTNLISQAYEGKWSDFPDFSQLKAANVEEEHDGIISLKDSPFKDNFAMVWTGSFEAPADGEYQFTLDADDAAAVSLDGKVFLDIRGAGPMNGSRAKVAKIKLTKGSHPFRMEFLEFSDQQGVALGWKGPGDKSWKWLSEDKSGKGGRVRDPIPIRPAGDRPVIYRNFIAGTTPRGIGVGFPGGVNLAWSADDMAPEMIWTGEFIDGSAKWVERGTDNSPPAGENVVNLTRKPVLPSNARFRGYKLDPAGNPTFSIQIGEQILLDSWSAETRGLVRKLVLNGGGSPLQLRLADQTPEGLEILSGGKPLGALSVSVPPGQPVTLTYKWK